MTDSKQTLVLASRNQKKLRELQSPLARYGLQLITVDQLPEAPHVEEDGSTFEENAALKASSVAEAVGMWALGDDSGLEVDALDGAPGIYSARYSGDNATDQRNNEKLLTELKSVPESKRGAQFVCHLAVADPHGEIQLRVAGHCRGRILEEIHGSGGFGYDPLFYLPEYHRTFGQMTAGAKNVLSHRGRAFQRLVPPLIELLGLDVS